MTIILTPYEKKYTKLKLLDSRFIFYNSGFNLRSTDISASIGLNQFKRLNKLPKFELIIDCCAEAAVEVSKKDLDRVINTNLIGTFNILKKANKDKSKLIFISSSRVNSINKINKLVKNTKNLRKIKIKPNPKCSNKCQ